MWDMKVLKITLVDTDVEPGQSDYTCMVYSAITVPSALFKKKKEMCVSTFPFLSPHVCEDKLAINWCFEFLYYAMWINVFTFKLYVVKNLVNCLHFYRTFIQSALQFASDSPIHTHTHTHSHTDGSYLARYWSDCLGEQSGDQCLAQGRFDMWTVQ